MATINLFKLAKTIHQYIKANGVVTRVDLNREFKAGNDFKATEALNAVLKSLIHNNHLLRHAGRDSSTVFFWVPGADTSLVADTNAVINPPDIDYLSEPPEPVSPSLPLTSKPNLAFTPPVKEVTVSAVASPSVLDAEGVKNRFSGVDRSSTDSLLLDVSDRIEFFTSTFILQTFKDIQPNVLAMRLATMVNRRQLVRSEQKPYLYWKPGNAIPAGYTEFTPEERPNQSRRAKLERLNSQKAEQTDLEKVVAEKLKETEAPKVDTTEINSSCFVTGQGFVLRSEQLKLTLPLEVSILILQIALQLNIPEALKALQEANSKGTK